MSHRSCSFQVDCRSSFDFRENNKNNNRFSLGPLPSGALGTSRNNKIFPKVRSLSLPLIPKGLEFGVNFVVGASIEIQGSSHQHLAHYYHPNYLRIRPFFLGSQVKKVNKKKKKERSGLLTDGSELATRLALI